MWSTPKETSRRFLQRGSLVVRTIFTLTPSSNHQCLMCACSSVQLQPVPNFFSQLWHQISRTDKKMLHAVQYHATEPKDGCCTRCRQKFSISTRKNCRSLASCNSCPMPRQTMSRSVSVRIVCDPQHSSRLKSKEVFNSYTHVFKSIVRISRCTLAFCFIKVPSQSSKHLPTSNCRLSHATAKLSEHVPTPARRREHNHTFASCSGCGSGTSSAKKFQLSISIKNAALETAVQINLTLSQVSVDFGAVRVLRARSRWIGARTCQS